MTQKKWLQLNMKFLLGYSGNDETSWEFLELFSFWVEGGGENFYLAEGGHLFWSSPAGKTPQEKLLKMYFYDQIYINKNLHNFLFNRRYDHQILVKD